MDLAFFVSQSVFEAISVHISVLRYRWYNLFMLNTLRELKPLNIVKDTEVQ